MSLQSLGIQRDIPNVGGMIRMTLPIVNIHTISIQKKGSIVYDNQDDSLYISTGTEWERISTDDHPSYCIESPEGDTSVCTDTHPPTDSKTITFTTSSVPRGRILPTGETQFDASLTLMPTGVAAGDTGEMRYRELAANGTNYVGFKAPDLIPGTVIWTLPDVDGGAGDLLSTDGSGVLSWIAGGGSGSFADNVFNIYHDTDPLARIFFNAGAITSVDRTFFAPNSDGMLPLVDSRNNVALGETTYGLIGSTGSHNTFVGNQAGIGNTTASNNTAYGSRALQVNSTSSQNAAFGSLALQDNTGNDNTAFGYRALTDNIGGVFNTAAGSSCMQLNTTGLQNAAFGSLALQLANASFNCAFGHAALQQTTSGTNNTAVGHSALNVNDTGSRNTAVGFQAAQSSGTVDDITAVGYNALATNQTGTQCTAMGSFALTTNFTGTDNTGFGFSALRANVVGTDNTAFGCQALRNVTGSGNVGVGRSAGITLTTGSNNVLVGNNTNVGANSHSNCIIFGNGATSTASGQMVITGSMSGTAVLVGGTVVVASTSVTASSRILLTTQSPAGVPGFVYISARVANTSFTILSSSGADTSTVAWFIFEP
jgi:hypothetical protein